MFTKKWKVRKTSKKLPSFKGLSDLSLQLLKQRKIQSSQEIESFLFPHYERDLNDPFLFSEMKKSVKRIEKAILEKEKVLIFSDYDADGVTSAAVLKTALDDLGLTSQVYIPDKSKEGYGMNWLAVEKFLKKGFKLIITVDCGISNYEVVKKINQFGADVIITDHHHIPEKIPQALAIINPQLEKQRKNAYPFYDLAGVGVAFKLVQAIYQRLLPEKEEQLKWLLDLVAIGTVADCVPLIGENRVLTKYGLLVLSKTKRAGLKELFQVGKIKIDEDNFPDANKISFQIAPRINAAGRMEHAQGAFNLIFSQNRVEARELALELEAQNSHRQKATRQIVTEIKKIAENSFKDKSFIFVAESHYPIGIVGLVAGQVADYFRKPTAVLHKKEKISVGSFRSIPAINIIEIIEKLDYLLERFGGHSQAAGIRIKNENLEKFYEKMNNLIEEELEGKDVTPRLDIDLELDFAEISFVLAQEIQKMEPFGEGNPEPVFLTKNLFIQDLRWLGNGEKHLKLFLSDEKRQYQWEAIGFNLLDQFSELKIGDKIDLVYNLQVNNWNGNQNLQLKIVDLRKVN